MCQHSRLLPLHLRAATHLQCSPQAMRLWWWVSQVVSMQTCDWWKKFVNWLAFMWLCGPEAFAPSVGWPHDCRAWTIKDILAVLAFELALFPPTFPFPSSSVIPVCFVYIFMSSIIFSSLSCSDRTAAHKDICFREVDEDLMCTLPRNEQMVTYSECCCHYGRGWGPECRTCPNRNSGIAKKSFLLTKANFIWSKIKY